jgi:hypothetical protein
MRVPGIAQLLLAFGLILGIATGSGIAAAQTSQERGVEAFTRAVKAYDSGDWSAASAAIDEAMKANLSKDLQARAINLRGHVFERTGALARALQDYSTALFMDTLPPNERKEAQEGKQRVIAAMGLNSYTPGSKQASAASDAASQGSSGGGGWSMFNVFGSSSSAPEAAPPPAQPAQTAPQGSSGGGMWSMFNVFGSSNSTPETPAAAPEAPPASQASAVKAKPGSHTSASPIVTRSTKAVAAAKPAAVAKPIRAVQSQAPVQIASIQPAVTPASAAAGYMIVFGAVGSEGAGRARAGQIKTALADILVSRTVDLEASAKGGYRIVAGPYKAKNAALALCSAMKQRGVSCQVSP